MKNLRLVKIVSFVSFIISLYYAKQYLERQLLSAASWRNTALSARLIEDEIKSNNFSLKFSVKLIGKKFDKKVSSKLSAYKSKENATKWRQNIQPFYRLDRTKLLLPVLHNGPNNQMIGFQQSVLLAILLNRTIVLPRFYLHTYGDMIRKTAPVESRLNVEELRKLVPVISIREAKKICENKFDVFFYTFNHTDLSLAKALIEMHIGTGIRGLNYKKNYSLSDLADKLTSEDISQILFADRNSWLTGPFLFSTNKHETNLKPMFSAFETEAKCAFYCCPFRQITARTQRSGGLPQLWPRSKQEILIDPWKNVVSNEDASVIMDEIIKHSPPNPIVIELAKLFKEQMLSKRNKSEYLAIHWRYDEEDYFRYMCRDHYTSLRNTPCRMIQKATNSSAFAKAIASKLTSLLWKGRNISFIYISAPHSMDEFISDTKLHFQTLIPRGELELRSGVDLIDFIKRTTREQQWFRKEDILLDILSQIEMEICIQSEVFVWSKLSTWSQRAIINRSLFYSKPNPDGEHVIGMILKNILGVKRHRDVHL